MSLRVSNDNAVRGKRFAQCAVRVFDRTRPFTPARITYWLVDNAALVFYWPVHKRAVHLAHLAVLELLFS
jgi:hypothetical protein